MNIVINKNGDKHIQNLAFMKAILIQEYIEHIDTNLEEKEAIKKEVLEFLQKTWRHPFTAQTIRKGVIEWRKK